MNSIRIGVLVLALVLVGTAASQENEKSRSPFSRSPADVAMDEPCRFIGTFHKESRQRLEVFRVCDAISLQEWKCMAQALEVLDDEMTRSCKEKPQLLETIEARQSELYTPCLPPSAEEVIRCSLLSTDRTCRENVCR